MVHLISIRYSIPHNTEILLILIKLHFIAQKLESAIRINKQAQ